MKTWHSSHKHREIRDREQFQADLSEIQKDYSWYDPFDPDYGIWPVPEEGMMNFFIRK